MAAGDQRRVHACRHGFLTFLVHQTLTDSQQLDGGVCGLGRFDVGDGDVADAFGMHVLAGHAGVECQGGQDGGLAGGVKAVDVGGRVGLRVTQLGGLCQHLVVAGTPGVHCVENEVSGAVDNAHHLVDLVAGKGAAQRANHRDGSGNGGLEEQVHSGLVGSDSQLISVSGDERLIGGDDGLACAQRRQHDLARVLDAADDLDDQVNVVAGYQR